MSSIHVNIIDERETLCYLILDLNLGMMVLQNWIKNKIYYPTCDGILVKFYGVLLSYDFDNMLANLS